MGNFQAMQKIPRLNREVIITEKIDGTNASVVIDLVKGENEALPAADPDAVAYVAETQPEAPINGYEAFSPTGRVFAVYAGARNDYRQPGKGDNFGWAGFVQRNAEALVRALGPGRHYGEWWGPGIQRRYGVAEKTFSLFNVSKWGKVEGYLDPRCVVTCPCGKPQEAHTGEYVCLGVQPKHQTDRSGVKRCACREAREAISLDLDGGRVRSVPVLYTGPWFMPEAAHSAIRTGSPSCASWAPEWALWRLQAAGSFASPGFMRPEGIVVFHEASGALFKATLEGDEKPKGVK